MANSNWLNLLCILGLNFGLIASASAAQSSSIVSHVAVGAAVPSILGAQALTVNRSFPVSASAQVGLRAPALLGDQANIRVGGVYEPFSLRNGSNSWLMVAQVWGGLGYRAKDVIWRIAPTVSLDAGVQFTAFQATSVFVASPSMSLAPLVQFSPGLDFALLNFGDMGDLGLWLESPIQAVFTRAGVLLFWNGSILLRWRFS